MGKKKQKVRWSLVDGLKWNSGNQEEVCSLEEESTGTVAGAETVLPTSDENTNCQPELEPNNKTEEYLTSPTGGYQPQQQSGGYQPHHYHQGQGGYTSRRGGGGGYPYHQHHHQVNNQPNWRENIAPRFEKRQYQNVYNRQQVYYEGEYCDTEELPNGFTKIRSKNLDILFKRDYYEQRIAQKEKEKTESTTDLLIANGDQLESTTETDTSEERVETEGEVAVESSTGGDKTMIDINTTVAVDDNTNGLHHESDTTATETGELQPVADDGNEKSGETSSKGGKSFRSVTSFDQIDPNEIPEFRPMNSFIDMGGASVDETVVTTTTSTGSFSAAAPPFAPAAASYAPPPPRPNLYLYSPTNNTLIPCEEIIIPNPMMSADGAGPVYGGPTNIYLAYPVTGPDGRGGYITQPFSPPPSLTVPTSPSDYGGSCSNMSASSSSTSPHYQQHQQHHQQQHQHQHLNGGASVGGESTVDPHVGNASSNGGGDSSFSPSSSSVDECASQIYHIPSTPHTPNSGEDSGSSTQPTSPPPLINSYHPANWFNPTNNWIHSDHSLPTTPPLIPTTNHRKPNGANNHYNNGRYPPRHYNSSYNNTYHQQQHHHHGYHHQQPSYNNSNWYNNEKPLRPVFGGEVKPLLDPEELQLSDAAICGPTASNNSKELLPHHQANGGEERIAGGKGATSANNNGGKKSRLSEEKEKEETSNTISQSPSIQYIPGLPTEIIEQQLKKSQKKKRRKKAAGASPNGNSSSNAVGKDGSSSLADNSHRGSISSETDGGLSEPASVVMELTPAATIQKSESSSIEGVVDDPSSNDSYNNNDEELTSSLVAQQQFGSESSSAVVQEVHLTDDLADFMVNPPTDPECSDEEEKTPTHEVMDNVAPPALSSRVDDNEPTDLEIVHVEDVGAQAELMSRDSTLTDICSLVRATDLNSSQVEMTCTEEAEGSDSDLIVVSVINDASNNTATTENKPHLAAHSSDNINTDEVKQSKPVEGKEESRPEVSLTPEPAKVKPVPVEVISKDDHPAEIQTDTQPDVQSSLDQQSSLKSETAAVTDKSQTSVEETKSSCKTSKSAPVVQQQQSGKRKHNNNNNKNKKAAANNKLQQQKSSSESGESSSLISENGKESGVTAANNEPLLTEESKSKDGESGSTNDSKISLAPSSNTPAAAPTLSLSYSAVCKSTNTAATSIEPPSDPSPVHSPSMRHKTSSAKESSSGTAKKSEPATMSNKAKTDKTDSGSASKQQQQKQQPESDMSSLNDNKNTTKQDEWETVPPSLVSAPQKWEKKKDRKRSKNRGNFQSSNNPNSSANSLEPIEDDTSGLTESTQPKMSNKPVVVSREVSVEPRQQSSAKETMSSKKSENVNAEEVKNSLENKSGAKKEASPSANSVQEDAEADGDNEKLTRSKKSRRSKKKHASGEASGAIEAGQGGSGGAANAGHKVLIFDNQIDVRYSRSIRRADDILDGKQINTIRSTGFCDFLVVEKLGVGISRGSIGLGRLYQGKYVPPERLDGIVAERIKIEEENRIRHEQEEAEAEAAAAQEEETNSSGKTVLPTVVEEVMNTTNTSSDLQAELEADVAEDDEHVAVVQEVQEQAGNSGEDIDLD